MSFTRPTSGILTGEVVSAPKDEFYAVVAFFDESRARASQIQRKKYPFMGDLISCTRFLKFV